MRGYFAIGIENPKKAINIGTLWRSAFLFGAAYIFTIGGEKYRRQSGDTTNSCNQLPYFHYQDFDHFYKSIPHNCQLVGVEMLSKAREIKHFVHPERSIYLLGSESLGLDEKSIDKCDLIIKLPGQFSLNVSVAGSIILYDRINKIAS